MCCSIGKKYQIAPDTASAPAPKKKELFVCGICEKSEGPITKIWRSHISQRAHRACFDKIAAADRVLVEIIQRSVLDTEYQNRSHIASIVKVKGTLGKTTIIQYLESEGIKELTRLLKDSHQHYPPSTTKSKSSKSSSFVQFTI